jgi:hypothetical protein
MVDVGDDRDVPKLRCHEGFSAGFSLTVVLFCLCAAHPTEKWLFFKWFQERGAHNTPNLNYV